MKTTPWYDPKIKPVRIGIYERDMSGFGRVGRFSYWNGTYWCGWGGTIGMALGNGIHGHKSSVQCARWRGLRHPIDGHGGER